MSRISLAVPKGIEPPDTLLIAELITAGFSGAIGSRSTVMGLLELLHLPKLWVNSSLALAFR